MVNIIRKSSWEKQELLEYSTNSSGGMNGGSSSTVLSAYGDKALLTYSSKKWYYQDPTVTEYLINKDALDEVKQIFLKEGMYNWGGKKFTKHFVADGESTSYDFLFSEDSLNFHSQIYPEAYADKLDKLDRIIGKYSVDGERLPGLVLPELSEEEQSSRKAPEEGKVKMVVSEYSQNRLTYWVSNGTDAEMPLYGTYIITDESGNVVASHTDKREYPWTVYPGGDTEDSIELEERLPAGKYILQVDDMSCEFTIQ